MRRTPLILGSLAIASALTAVACDDSTSTGGAGGTSGSTTSSTKSSSGATMTTTGATMTTTGSTTTTTTTTTSSSSASSSVSTGSSMAGLDHLVINEVVVGPDAAEFFEIWNPTAQPVDLSDYYVSDNSDYWEVPAGMGWNPDYNGSAQSVGSDFLGGFPQGTTVPANGVITVAFKPGFETTYSKCPDFFVATTPTPCGGNMVPALTQPVAGTILVGGAAAVGLSNAREMLILFTWDGTNGSLAKDVDYALWGTTGGATNDDPGSRVDKTGKSTYLADTPHAMQKFAEAPMNGHAITRTGTEVGEKATGGNGLTGHDETSEDMSMSFVDSATPTPGVK